MHLNRRLPLVAALGALFVANLEARAQAAVEREKPDLEQLVDAWRDSHGRAWRHLADARTGRIELLYGGSAAAAFRPQTDADFEALASEFLAATRAMHGVDASTLVLDRSVFLPLGALGSTDKVTVRYRQEVRGVPVVGGSVNVLLDHRSGALLSVQSSALPDVERESVEPSLASVAAVERARAAFDERFGAGDASAGEAELVFVRRADAGVAGPVLAWQVDLRRELVGAVAEARRFWIDARVGAVVGSENLVHQFDVGGTIRANATPNTLPDTGANPPQSSIQPFIRVSSPLGIAKADANGHFNFAGATGPLACTFTYSGPYALITNAAGGEYSLTLNLSGTGNSVLMNPSPNQHDTAQANAYDEINLLRDWIRAVIPSDATADFQALGNCNIAATCNAYYDGASVNFFNAGGGCVNTAYSTVVAHEMGHWLNSRYSTGNGGDGMGEGNADVFAMYLYDNPIVGEGFCGSGCHIRSGNNTRQFCGDCCGGCYGEVHADGEVWMGAAWKVRRNLGTTHGGALGDAISDALFLGWMNAYDQTTIRSIVEVQWLTLDDDDGFIENGTPNYLDIDGAFREQGFPGFDLSPCFGASYCETSPNSVGFGAEISFTGSASIGQNDLVLHVESAPAGELGLYFYGSSATSVPFGNGIRCVGGSTFRLPIVAVGPGGSVAWPLDVNAPPQPAGQITSGSTWNFQFWYRDPAGGGANFNLSDALALSFCD